MKKLEKEDIKSLPEELSCKNIIAGKFRGEPVIFYHEWKSGTFDLESEDCYFLCLGDWTPLGNCYGRRGNTTVEDSFEIWCDSHDGEIYVFEDVFEFGSWLCEEFA